MAGRIPSLPLAPGPQFLEVDSSYGTQVELLTRLKKELKPGGVREECNAIFLKLDPNVQFQSYQFLCPNGRDKIETINKGMALFLRNPSALSGNIEDLLLFVKSRVPALEERAEVVTACIGGTMPRGIINLIGKYAMERFDDQMFGPQQWISCWGATPVMLPPVEKLRNLVLQMVTSTGKKPEKEVEKMGAEECANFLGLPGVEENAEPTEALYECLNRRVRPGDKLVAGFSCVVTYIPQFVRKGDTILAVTARTLALDLGPHPIQGETAQLREPQLALDRVLTPEDADRTEASCYFVMEQDVAPNTRGKKPSVLMAEITQQGDKGWQLPATRNFFAAVFSRRAWKGQFLYGKDPWNFTYGQEKARSGYFLYLGGSSADGLLIRGLTDTILDCIGAAGSRKFLPPLAK